MPRFACTTRHRVGRCVSNRQQRRDKRKSYKEAQKAQHGSRELFVLYEILRSHCNKPTGSTLEAQLSLLISFCISDITRGFSRPRPRAWGKRIGTWQVWSGPNVPSALR